MRGEPAMQLPPITAGHPAPVQIPAARTDAAARKAAQDFEAAFLAEMLKTAGVNAMPAGFGGGGAGEEAFSSLLTDEYARRMAAAGGIGLAEHVYRILKSR